MSATVADGPVTPAINRPLGAVVEILESPHPDEPIPADSIVCPTLVRINGLKLYANHRDPVIVEGINPLVCKGRQHSEVLLTITALAYCTLVDDPADLPPPRRLGDGTAGAVFELLHPGGSPAFEAFTSTEGRPAVGSTIRPTLGVRVVGAGEPVWVMVSADHPVVVGLDPVVNPEMADDERRPVRVSLTLLVRRLLVGDTFDALPGPGTPVLTE